MASFLFLDEEPVLELSDLNLLHVAALALCAFLTYFDLSLRSRWGQYVFKDGVVSTAALVFAWGLENYLRLLLLVFCLHNLMPFEADLLESLAVYQAWGAWLCIDLVGPLLAACLLVPAVYALNLSLASAGRLALLAQLL